MYNNGWCFEQTMQISDSAEQPLVTDEKHNIIIFHRHLNRDVLIRNALSERCIYKLLLY